MFVHVTYMRHLGRGRVGVRGEAGSGRGVLFFSSFLNFVLWFFFFS